MKRLADIFLFPLAYVSALLYIAYLKTIQVQVINEKFAISHMVSPNNPIYITWHAKTFLVIPFYRNQKICILTLLDWKNRFYDRMCLFLGFETVRVTSPQRATLQLVKLLKSGRHLAIAADGPYGPVGIVKPGPAYLAQKTGRPIVPTRVEIEKSFRLAWRWDQYEIPFPFTKAKIILNDPIYVTDSSDDVESKIKEALGFYLPIPSQPNV